VSQHLAVSGVSGQFEFELEGLCITRDMLASLLGPVRRDENTLVGVRLPAVVEDSQTGSDGTDLVQVDGFVIEVDAVQSPQLILVGPDGQAGPDPQAAELHDRLAKTASDTARDFLTWVRLNLRQYWIAPDGPPVLRESLVYVTGSQDIIVRHQPSPGRPVPFTLAGEVPGTAIPLSGPIITPGLHRVLSGEAAGLPERLLSSAFSKLWAGYPDAQTAVFLAALACETKVKAILRLKAPAGQQPLLELIIGDRRDVTTSAPNLFDGLCKAVTGRSLREDGPDALWQALVQLIRARNDIAHRGAEPGREDAGRYLETAIRVFGWLDALPAPRA